MFCDLFDVKNMMKTIKKSINLIGSQQQGQQKGPSLEGASLFSVLKFGVFQCNHLFALEGIT